MHRASRVSVIVATLLALVMQLVGALPAQAASSVADRIAAVSGQAFDRNSKALKDALVDALTPELTASPERSGQWPNHGRGVALRGERPVGLARRGPAPA